MKLLTQIEKEKILELITKLKEYSEYQKKLEKLPMIKEDFYLVLSYEILSQHIQLLLSQYEEITKMKKGIDPFLKDIHHEFQTQLSQILKQTSELKKDESINKILRRYHTLSEENKKELQKKFSLLNYYETLYFLHNSYLKLDGSRNDVFRFKENYLQVMTQLSDKRKSMCQNQNLVIFLKKKQYLQKIKQLEKEMKEIESNQDLPYLWKVDKRILSNQEVRYAVSCALHNTEIILSDTNDVDGLYVPKTIETSSKEQKRMELLEEVYSGKLKKFVYIKKGA